MLEGNIRRFIADTDKVHHDPDVQQKIDSLHDLEEKIGDRIFREKKGMVSDAELKEKFELRVQNRKLVQQLEGHNISPDDFIDKDENKKAA